MNYTTAREYWPLVELDSALRNDSVILDHFYHVFVRLMTLQS